MKNHKFHNIYFLPALFLILISCKTTQKKYNLLWDKDYLNKHSEVSNLIDQYQKGYICIELNTLRTDFMSHFEIITNLKNMGYKCESKPLYFHPDGRDESFLTKNGEATFDKNNKNIVYQEIWSKKHCIVRIKPGGFPGNRRPYPHANKSVIINPNFYSYDNEAFKITNNALAVPKGPGQDVGMAKCTDDLQKCNKRIDDVMSDLHPKLLLPAPGKFCNN